MDIIRGSRGSIDDMLYAIENKIAELESGSIALSEDIEDIDEYEGEDLEFITSSIDLTPEQEDKLNEIAERYNTSKPVSGDWSTETAHEQKSISDELGISMDDAKDLMISYLGFDTNHFEESGIHSSIDLSEDDAYLYDELEYGDSEGVYDTNYMTRLSDHVCDRMLDEFGAYMEAVVYPDCIEFTCYEDESANSVIFEDIVFGDELLYTEEDMSMQISDLCNKFWDMLWSVDHE